MRHVKNSFSKKSGKRPEEFEKLVEIYEISLTTNNKKSKKKNLERKSKKTRKEKIDKKQKSKKLEKNTKRKNN